MIPITLSAAHYKAIQEKQGTATALEALFTTIQSLTNIQRNVVNIVRDASLPLEVTFTPHRNLDGHKVAIVLPVRAAAWKENQKGYRVNLLTCGFGNDNEQCLEGLFNALINPQVPATAAPEALDSKEDEPAHKIHEEVIGLLVGSHAHPEMFIRFGA